MTEAFVNHSKSTRIFLLLGGVNMLLAVALGAFGAHALKASLAPDLMNVYQTGNQYHFYHGLGLLALAAAARVLKPSRLLWWSGACMLAGIVLFSGSLYALAVTGLRRIGMITPFGGTSFLIAWVLFILAALRKR